MDEKTINETGSEKEKNQSFTSLLVVLALVLVVIVFFSIQSNSPQKKYQTALNGRSKGWGYDKIYGEFIALGSYKDSEAKAENALFMMFDDDYVNGMRVLYYMYDRPSESEANQLVENGIISVGLYRAEDFTPLPDLPVRTLRQIRESLPKGVVSISHNFGVGLQRNGRVATAGSNEYGQLDVHEWSNMIALATGERHTVGLKRTGSVLGAGSNQEGQLDLWDWTDIVSLDAGHLHTVGLKKNGQVLAIGNNDYGQLEVAEWRNVIAVAAGENHTVGLLGDGQVMAVGNNGNGQCNVWGWGDVVAIAAGDDFTACLTEDGHVRITGVGAKDLNHLNNVVAISAGRTSLMTLHADGWVSGNSGWLVDHVSSLRNAENWRDVLAIEGDHWRGLWLWSDGSVHAHFVNFFGRDDAFISEIRRWQNIGTP